MQPQQKVEVNSIVYKYTGKLCEKQIWFLWKIAQKNMHNMLGTIE